MEVEVERKGNSDRDAKDIICTGEGKVIEKVDETKRLLPLATSIILRVDSPQVQPCTCYLHTPCPKNPTSDIVDPIKHLVQSSNRQDRRYKRNDLGVIVEQESPSCAEYEEHSAG